MQKPDHEDVVAYARVSAASLTSSSRQQTSSRASIYVGAIIDMAIAHFHYDPEESRQ